MNPGKKGNIASVKNVASEPPLPESNDPAPTPSLLGRALRVILPLILLGGAGVLAYWLVQTEPRARRRPPKRQAVLVQVTDALVTSEQAVVEAMRAEYPELEQESTYQLVDGQKVHGFDLGFYYLDLTNSALVRSFRTPVATYVVFYQAEDREFRQLEQVFAAITKSFFDSLD